MSQLQKTLDLAIKQSQNPGEKGFEVNKKAYNSYMTNEEWELFVKEMKEKYKTAFERYSEGSGGELAPSLRVPPKMASYGSSSRMIYLLSREIPGFLFEEKLKTTVGGIANLDGFMNNEKEYVFVEAKCREPYGAKTKTVKTVYESCYRFLSESKNTNFNCKISHSNENPLYMTVDFYSGNEKIEHFDIKQMISHLLGIATAILTKRLEEKPIKFVYLLFNPAEVLENEEIIKIYSKTKKECESFNFKNILCDLLVFLGEYCGVGDIKKGADALAGSFSFKLCSQKEYKNIIG